METLRTTRKAGWNVLKSWKYQDYKAKGGLTALKNQYPREGRKTQWARSARVCGDFSPKANWRFQKQKVLAERERSWAEHSTDLGLGENKFRAHQG